MRFLILIFLIFSFNKIMGKPGVNISNFPYTLIKEQVSMNANNISTCVWNTGVFNQDLRTTNTPGFEWPKGSGKFAIWSTGLSIGTYINNELRLATISSNGEYAPGYTSNGIFYTNNNFKLCKVKRGDNSINNPDYANWSFMVPYGAPYNDVNNNGTYEPLIDTPGVKNAEQTIFICLTDADASNHSSSEGFSGGTLPVFSEMHFTMWAYTASSLADVQYVKIEVVNKNNSPWDKTYFGLIVDPDLGDVSDDRVGCDTNRNLAYCYNGDNQDGTGGARTYGANPPAVGFDILKGAVNKNTNTSLNMSSFNYYLRSGGGQPPSCEWPPNDPIHAYNYMSGLKRDGTSYINPLTMQTTKYNFPGDPETGAGWTEYKGHIANCGGTLTDSIVPLNQRDVHFMQNSGADDLTILPGEKQTFIFAQMIARGTNNLNSVTKLKQLDDVVQTFYDSNYTIWITPVSTLTPDRFSLYQNYPNPFNPSTTIKFDISKPGFVSLVLYDSRGKEVENIINQSLSSGTYEYQYNASKLSSGIYFYQLKAAEFLQTKKMVLIK